MQESYYSRIFAQQLCEMGNLVRKFGVLNSNHHPRENLSSPISISRSSSLKDDLFLYGAWEKLRLALW